MNAMSSIDVAIIVVYLVGVLAVGVLATRREKMTSNVYFLAGRSLTWGVIGAALFASNISTIHLVGLTASGYNEGLVWGNFEWMAVVALVLLSLVFAPFYFRTKISTLPEFLEKRYSPAARSALAFLAIVAALFIHIGMSLYAGALVFQEFFGIDVLTSIIVVSVVVSVYTVVGGLKAVVITETIQTVIMVFGACLITYFAIRALPEHGIHDMAGFKAALRPQQLSMIHTNSAVGLNWYAVLLGYPVLGIWYWCTDQTIVQRVLGARTERDAQLGPLFAGVLKILTVFLLVVPGVIAYALFRDIIGTNSNQTLPVLIRQLVPTGLKGLISAAVLSALMSTVASALNSTGTLVAVDIVKRLRPQLSDRALVTVGRVSGVVVMVLALLWSTQGGRYASIFEAINAIAANLAPPITTVFLFGVFWKRGTNAAALFTLAVGFVLGAVAFTLDLPVFGTERILTHRFGISFLMQAWWLFAACSVLFVVVSLLTPPPAADKIRGLTWDRTVSTSNAQRGWTSPGRLSLVLLAALAVLYVVFR